MRCFLKALNTIGECEAFLFCGWFRWKMLVQKTVPDSAADIDRILHPKVRDWFYSRFGEYSLPQRFSLMEVHSRKNLLLFAPTGATKTLSAFLSVVNELYDLYEKSLLSDDVYCVYVSPLKALSYDIEVNLLEPLRQICGTSRQSVRVAVRTGDTPASEKARMLRTPPHILITTPESLAIALSSRAFRRKLQRVQWLIVDEIHSLADNKRGVHLSLSMERLQRMSPGLCRVGLSATVAPLDEVARFLVGMDTGSPRPCTLVYVSYLKKTDLKILCPAKDISCPDYSAVHGPLCRMLHELISGHRTTLVFTNTRAATERIVESLRDRYPRFYSSNIGAHHGSLSREHRRTLEEGLRSGQMKAVVTSTSLELGIDIGYIDLVIQIGSPKSVARCLQRIGRSGHCLHATAKGRIIAIDRDELVECAVLLRSALENSIDRIRVPGAALDVLAQQVTGIVLEGQVHIEELYSLVKSSYCYRNLSRKSFMAVIDYLGGAFAELKERHVFAKLWYDPQTGMLGARGRMTRAIYMSNIGTIPDEARVSVRVGTQEVGTLDEAFLERLRRGDVFVLGGEKYEFRYSKGMVAQVSSSVYRPPTVPSWFSEMLPLSFDLGLQIGRFRRLATEKLSSATDARNFMEGYLPVDARAANAIQKYLREQHLYAAVAHDRLIVVEDYYDEKEHYHIFHCVLGRRVNEAFARVIAYIASRLHARDVEINVNDNGFYVSAGRRVNIEKALAVLKASNVRELLSLSLEKTEIIQRRFRHCAARAYMILRSYRGKRKSVGRQQISSRALYNAAKRISDDFPIIAEARREVMEDYLCVDDFEDIVSQIRTGKIRVHEIQTQIPSPFAFNIILSGYADVLQAHDRAEFLRRMHDMVIAKISLKTKEVVELCGS